MNSLSFSPLSGLPEISAGSDLAQLLFSALADIPAQSGDILVVTHKILSKAAGLVRPLEDVQPSPRAQSIADAIGKDPRLLEVILDCSETLHVCDHGLLIARRRDGWVCCNAGVDASNTGAADALVLLPEDCDQQAEALSRALSRALGFPLPVIICDTHGRALRSGTCGVVVGSFGLEPIRRYTGQQDRGGRVLASTQEAVADEIAAAATLVMGQGAEGIPAVLVRGFAYTWTEVDSSDLRLPPENQIYQPRGTVFPGNTP